MNAFYDTFQTVFGKFSIAVDDRGAVVATCFGDADRLASRARNLELGRSKSLVSAARDQVLAYCAGERRTFSLPLAPAGTVFQQRVWAELSRIPFGATRSYADVATALGSPLACRAVGRANATNPICLIVPCHRVIGRNGSLTGFAFGEDLKRALLTHEARVITLHHASPSTPRRLSLQFT